MDRVGQRGELLLELRKRQVGRIRMPFHVLGRRGRRLPRVMMRADLAIAARLQSAQHVHRPRIDRHRMGNHVGRPDTVAREQRVQPRQRVDVLEPLIRARGRVPLVVAFGVDAD